MKALRNFMEDDEMDYTEAIEAAISKWKYLLNSLFDLEHFPTDPPMSTWTIFFLFSLFFFFFSFF